MTTPKLTENTQLSLLPLRDVVVFPHMVIPLFVGRPKSIKALEIAMEQGKCIMLAAQKAAAKDEPAASDIYPIGCVANILQMLKKIPKALYLELSIYYEAVLLSIFYQAPDLQIDLLCTLKPTKTIIMDFA